MNKRRDDRTGEGMLGPPMPRGPRRSHVNEASRPTPADLPPGRQPVDNAAALTSAVEALGLSIVIVEADGTVGYASGALARLLGLPAGRIVHRRLGSLLPGLESGEAAALLQHTLSSGESVGLRVDHGAGSARRTLAIRARRTADGRLALDLSDATEAVDRERAQHLVIEASGEALMELDSDWRVVHWNVAAERLTHVARRTVLGRPLWELWPGLRGTMVEKTLRATMRDRQPRELVRWHDHRHFGRRVLDIRSVTGHDGGMIVFFNETSARLREQGVLTSAVEENFLLRELAGRLADTPDSATLLRELADIARRECAAMGGGMASVRAGEVEVLAMVGRGLQQPGTRLPLAASPMAAVVESRRLTRHRLGDSALHPDMLVQPQVGEVMIAPLVAYDQVVGVLAVVRGRSAPRFSTRDERRLRLVSDHAALTLWRSRLLEQALAANEARGNFLATISHELRTPLTALIGYSELVADEIFGSLSDGQKEIVERMRAVTLGLSSIVDELLSFADLEHGRERLRLLDVNGGSLLQAAVAVVEPLARQKGLRVRTVVPEPAPSLHTDPEKVRQILVNLAGNAVKFTDEGEVCFTLEHDADEVRFLIRDTGPGIPPDAQDRIFEPFTQLDRGLTRRHGGTGLGLYVASRLAGLLDGRIEFASHPGEGSSFVLVLPRHAGR